MSDDADADERDQRRAGERDRRRAADEARAHEWRCGRCATVNRDQICSGCGLPKEASVFEL